MPQQLRTQWLTPGGRKTPYATVELDWSFVGEGYWESLVGEWKVAWTWWAEEVERVGWAVSWGKVGGVVVCGWMERRNMCWLGWCVGRSGQEPIIIVDS